MKILITAGPTAEDIDDVRFITNRSSGKMGYTLAEKALSQGHEVILISGPVCLTPVNSAEMVYVRSATEMLDKVLENLPEADVLIMTAAVADYTPRQRIEGKRHKNPDDPTEEWALHLVRTPDILKKVNEIRSNKLLVIGFSLEPTIDSDRAEAKLTSKGLDAIVANDTSSFGSENGRFKIIFKDSTVIRVGESSKSALADILLDWLKSQC